MVQITDHYRFTDLAVICKSASNPLSVAYKRLKLKT